MTIFDRFDLLMSLKKEDPMTLKQRRERNMKRERLAYEVMRLRDAARLLGLLKTANTLAEATGTIALEMNETNQR